MTIQRDPATGFVTGTQLDNVTTQTTYNDFGERETHTAWFGATMLYFEQHERDDLGRITKTTEIVEGVTKVWEYGYDLDARLSEAYVDGDLRFSYTYDPNGNRTKFEDPVAGVVITADYDDQDRLLRYGDSFFTYTENGELLRETSPAGVTTYDYDVFSNLLALGLPDGTVVDYAVDPRDRRIATFTDGVSEDGFVYRDQLEPIARIDSGGAVDQRYVYGAFDHVPDALVTSPATFAYVTDIRGSVRLVVDSDLGTITERIDYSPFGIPTATSSAQPFGFDGGLVFDAGLTRFGARDYDALTGRWKTKDAVGLVGGTDLNNETAISAGSQTNQELRTRWRRESRNLFIYSADDPVNQIDPWGRAGRPLTLPPTPQPPIAPPNACGDWIDDDCDLVDVEPDDEYLNCFYYCPICRTTEWTRASRDGGCPTSITVTCEVVH